MGIVYIGGVSVDLSSASAELARVGLAIIVSASLYGSISAGGGE